MAVIRAECSRTTVSTAAEIADDALDPSGASSVRAAVMVMASGGKVLAEELIFSVARCALPRHSHCSDFAASQNAGRRSIGSHIV